MFFYDVLNNMLSNNVLKTGQNGPSRELASSTSLVELVSSLDGPTEQ
jgi:hypothetical protein